MYDLGGINLYTVGQVSKFLGISRDTIKFYEEKKLLHPKQDVNGYRKYNLLDINEIITVNFYRDIDIEIKKIKEIKDQNSVDAIESILDEKERQLAEEIEYKTLLLKRTQEIKQNCQSIKKNLNQFTIKEMKPVVITNEVEMNGDIEKVCHAILKNYDESSRIKKAVHLSGLSRLVYFNEAQVTKERYVFYETLDQNGDEEREVLSFQKCLYIVIAVPVSEEGNDVDETMAATINETAKQLGFETRGIAVINLLFNGYQMGKNIQYLEVYTPIK